MRFGHIEIFSRDPIRSSEFYTSLLGFEVVGIQGGVFVWMKLGEAEILLRPGQPPTSPDTYPHAAMGLVLYTDDLMPLHDRIAREGLNLDDVDKTGKCFAFTDPDGNWIQIVNPDDM